MGLIGPPAIRSDYSDNAPFAEMHEGRRREDNKEWLQRQPVTDGADQNHVNCREISDEEQQWKNPDEMSARKKY